MTELHNQLFESIQDFLIVTANHANPKYKKLFEKYENMVDMDGFLAQIAAVNTPSPIGYADMINRAPYANPKMIKENFAGAIQRGWLIEKEMGVFIASDKAQEFFVEIYDIAKKVYTELNDHVKVDLERIVELFWVVMKTALETKTIADKPALIQSVKFSPREGDDFAPLYIFRNQIGDLQAYRDDCHVSAWKEYQIAGYVWEIFSYIWKGKANTLAGFIKELPPRGYEEDVYAGGLQELVDRGWIVQKGNQYEITDTGLTVRDKAEDLTNQKYFAAFVDLSNSELNEMNELLKQLIEELQLEVEVQS